MPNKKTKNRRAPKAPQNSGRRQAPPKGAARAGSAKPSRQGGRPAQPVRSAPPKKEPPKTKSAPQMGTRPNAAPMRPPAGNTPPPPPPNGAGRAPDRAGARRRAKAYNSAVRSRSVRGRRRGSRGGNYILYYLLAGIIALVVLVILARTLLFNCNSIEVEGNSRYTAEEVIERSALTMGESLLSIDTERAQTLISTLDYIDTAKVEKIFPTKIKITVTEAEKWYCVRQDGRTVTVSHGGKIIEQTAQPGLPVIIGYEAENLDSGKLLTSAVEGKQSIPADILTAAQTAGVKNITEIDITDRFSITILCDGRITLEIGNMTDLENKLSVAAQLINEKLSETESVTVNLTNYEAVYVRDKNIGDTVPVQPDGPEDGTGESADDTGSAETDE